jgi:hypothetical protein
MDLVAQVLRAIEERPVHPEEFERCACALLQARYPGLSAVEGGHDFGRDADIYFPFGGGDVRSRGRLLATTGDPVANLRRGLQRMQQENVRVDLVVMACLGPVNASVRAHLDRLCEDRGLLPPHIYAQGWLVAQLVRNSDWRYRLLGVRGELGALLAKPLETLEHTTPDLPALIGRDASRLVLQSAIDGGRDVVLAGVPGVGKTRLMYELEREVAFLQPANPGQVVDALVQMCPAAVVVDDAHDRLDDLRVLRQARVQEGLAFSIIATTWPDQVEEVAAGLPGADALAVERLERSDMDAVVRSVGVTGHWARMVILQQAEGRPGWALASCEALVSGNTHEVVTGVAHLAYAERFLRRATESATALDTVACVAALTDTSPEVVHQLASLVGAPPAEVVGMLDRLTHNGLLERTSRSWFLQPALRPPLIARWFFSDPARRPWSTLVNAFPEHAQALTSAAIAAARMGALRARQAADAWAQSASSGSFTWDAASCVLLAEYAALDKQTARFAISRARAILAADRPPQQITGVDYDPVAQTVKGLIAQIARQWLLPEAVSALLDLAVADPRPRPQNPDHPLRVLGDLAHGVDPDFGTMVSIRETVLDSTLGWLTDKPEPGNWVTAAELLAAVFSPEVSGSWPDPGTPRTVTFSQGIESAANLERLIQLWARVDKALAADRQASEPVCPPEAVALLVDLVGDWWRLGAGVGFGADEVSNDRQQAGRAGARRILESLRVAAQHVPGLALRAQRLLDHNQVDEQSDGQPAPFDLDLDLLDLVGGHHHSDDVDAGLRDQEHRVSAIAGRLASLGPTEGTARLAELIRQARLSGNEAGGHADWVATRMQPYMTDPVAWYRAANDLHVLSVFRAALAQILDHDPTALPAETLSTHLHDPVLRPVIFSAVLARAKLDPLGQQAIAYLSIPDVPLLYSLTGLNEPNEVLHHLLRHPIPAIAGATALTFSIGQQPYGPPLPDDWRPDWATAIQNLRVNELDQNTRWRAGRVLRHLAAQDPDLFEHWFEHRLDDMSTQSLVGLVEPYGCENHLSELPQSHRERLARHYSQISTGKPRAGQSLLTYLIGADRDLAERLLTEQTITTDHLLDTILGQRNAVLEQLGPLLLELGIHPERIAAHTGFPTGFRFGPESGMHAQMFEYFASLAERVPALQSVAQAGCAQQAIQRQKAEAQERQKRVRGY